MDNATQSDESATVPIQTIKFSSDPHKKPVATAQLSLTSCEGCGASVTCELGWLMNVHGSMNLALQLQTVVAVEVTFELSLWGGGIEAEYDILVNNQMLVHRRKFEDMDFTPHGAIIPANLLQVGGNSIVLTLSDRGDSNISVKSVTVRSDFSA